MRRSQAKTRSWFKSHSVRFITQDNYGIILSSFWVVVGQHPPALLCGVLGNLCLYWTATFIGSSAIAPVVHKKFKNAKAKQQEDGLSA
jgi:hypothetical protein